MSGGDRGMFAVSKGYNQEKKSDFLSVWIGHSGLESFPQASLRFDLASDFVAEDNVSINKSFEFKKAKE